MLSVRIAKRKLRYTKLIGDEDSKIVTADPYPGTKVEKLEFIGQMQKMGSRLRQLRNTHKGVLSDGKGILGQGRLTEKLMNKLVNKQNVNKTVR